MKEDVLIEVEGLSKKFCKDLKTSLWYGLKDVTTNAFGGKAKASLRPKEFWALKDINFQLKRGECLGLIGHNGAGKSTLLKILNGLIKPDAGKVTIRGKVGALIELGAGFNPILTGRENIYNNGAVLGFSKAEIDAKLEAIIDFAEIREFIDMPVQNYSSGMKVRLGFAVASQMEPDVLIIDEVLAVGDVAFRAKCYERINELLDSCCVIFVTHNMPQVSKICNSAIHLNRGVVNIIGDTGEVIEQYYESLDKVEKKHQLLSNDCELISFEMSKKEINNFNDEINFSIKINSFRDLYDVELNMVVLSRELVPVYQGSSKILNQKMNMKKGVNEFVFSTSNLNLNTGVYTISLTVDDVKSGKKFLWMHNLEKFSVNGKFIGVSPALLNGKWISK